MSNYVYQNCSRPRLRELAAKRITLLAAIADVRKREAAIEANLDVAVDLHQRMATPIQRSLKELENSAIARIVAREAVDPVSEQKRQNFLQQLEQENAALELARKDAGMRLKLLKDERDAIMRQLPDVAMIEAELFKTGDPEKQLQYWGLNWAADMADEGSQAARKKQEDCDQAIINAKRSNQKSAVDLWEGRRPKWAYAKSAIGKAAADLRQQANELRREIIES